jgi:glutaredoxin
MEPLTLLYCEGCPYAEQARRILQNTGYPFTSVRTESLPPGHPQRGYTSPTILLGERVLYGMGGGEVGCSVGPIDGARIQAEIRAAAAV